MTAGDGDAVLQTHQFGKQFAARNNRYAKPPRFEDALDRAKSRFAGIVTDLGLDTPKELEQ